MTKENRKENRNYLLLALIMGFGLGLGAVLSSLLGFAMASIVVSALVLVLSLIAALFIALFFALRIDSYDAYVKFDELDKSVMIILFFIIGLMIGGIIAYQYIQNNIISTTIPQSTYQGIVQAIHTNLSSITFTTGQIWQGNLSRVFDLNIGADCTLIQNGSHIASFISGACK